MEQVREVDQIPALAQQLREAKSVCFDTSALIYIFNRSEPYFRLLEGCLNLLEREGKKAIVSVITQLELLVKPIKEANQGEVQRITDYIGADPWLLVDVDAPLAYRGARVRALYDLDTPDALIIATALETSCDFIIGNDRNCAERVKEIPYLYLEHLVHH